MEKSVLVLGNVYFSREDGSKIKKGQQWTRCHSYLIESGPAMVATLKELLSFTALDSPSFTYGLSLVLESSLKMNSNLQVGPLKYLINVIQLLLLWKIENKSFVKINCTLGYSTKDIMGKYRVVSKTNIIKNNTIGNLQIEYYR